MSRPKRGNREEEIIEAGLEVFAKRGYYQTTTALIAEKAGISQPYVFKFFKTKEVLFETALSRAYERINRSLQNVKADPDHLIEAMIAAYENLSDSRPYEVALQVIGLSVPEAAIMAVTRRGLLLIRKNVLNRFREAGIKNAEREVTRLMAEGILCNISFFLELPELMEKQAAEK